MIQFKTLQDLKKARQIIATSTLGLVPTMGYLHAGHGSLVERSKKENQKTWLTIFVNPTQFNNADDLKNYPRNLERDLELCAEWGVDAVFMPDYKDLYPDNYNYKIQEQSLSKLLEGAYRPGHFEGVLTVVLKLFNLIAPHRAYFGEKDYQQLEVIRGMVKAFFLPIQIVPVPTLREESGLAMSSRNVRLGPHEKALAPELYKILREARTVEEAKEKLNQAGFNVDYVEEMWGRRLAAAHLGNVRLIDNTETLL